MTFSFYKLIVHIRLYEFKPLNAYSQNFMDTLQRRVEYYQQ